MRFIVFCCLFIAFLGTGQGVLKGAFKGVFKGALAQTNAIEERILPAPVVAVAPNMIAHLGEHYMLWGTFVTNFSPHLYKDSLDNLNRAIGRGGLTCLIYQKAQPAHPGLAQCFNGQDKDIASFVIEQGYVATLRSAVHGSDYEDVYLKAERDARANNLGIWNTRDQYAEMFDQLGERISFLTIFSSALFVVLVSMLVAALVMGRSRLRLISDSLTHATQLLNKEIRLRKRETDLASVMLHAELKTNASKVDAFLVIYSDLLKTLKDPYADHKYLRTGEIVRTAPALERYIYDANASKLDGLEPDLAQRLVEFYGRVEMDPPYSNLEPSMEHEQAIAIVEGVVKKAESVKDEIDEIVNLLASSGYTSVDISFAS